MTRIVLIISFIIINLADSLAGGGWIAKKGEGYFKLGETWMRSDELFARNGEKTSITTTGVYITSLYGEYGLGNNLEAMVRLPLLFRTTINEVQYLSGRPGIPGDEYNYPGDPSLGLKYGLIQNKPFVLSAQLRLDLPLGKTDGGESELIQTGDGEFNQLLKFDAGYSTSSGKLYTTGGVGVNNRTKNFSDELHFSFEAGYKFANNFFFITRLYGIETFENGDVAGNNTGIFSNNMEQLLITPILVYENKNRLGIEASYSFPISGQNVLAAPMYDVGIFYKLSK